MTCPLYTCTVAYTGQFTFSKVPEETGQCLTGHPVLHTQYDAGFAGYINGNFVDIHHRKSVTDELFYSSHVDIHNKTEDDYWLNE